MKVRHELKNFESLNERMSEGGPSIWQVAYEVVVRMNTLEILDIIAVNATVNKNDLKTVNTGMRGQEAISMRMMIRSIDTREGDTTATVTLRGATRETSVIVRELRTAERVIMIQNGTADTLVATRHL